MSLTHLLCIHKHKYVVSYKCFCCLAHENNDELMAICSVCLIARYCNEVCQKKDWTTHKPLCTQWRNFRDAMVKREGSTWKESLEWGLFVQPMIPNIERFIKQVISQYRSRLKKIFIHALKRMNEDQYIAIKYDLSDISLMSKNDILFKSMKLDPNCNEGAGILFYQHYLGVVISCLITLHV